MKNKMKACAILLCLGLCGCGSNDTGVYLESSQQAWIPIESEVSDSDTECVTKEGETPLLVYVCGEVQNPGVYELPAGSRVCDAVEAAGGFTEKASRDYWNLAELLTDGQMISFPDEEKAAEREKYAGQTAVHEEDGRVNINTADVQQLQQLPGIGQTRAEAIIAYRDRHGAFESVEDIMKVSGIKNALFEKMRDDITVD